MENTVIGIVTAAVVSIATAIAAVFHSRYKSSAVSIENLQEENANLKRRMKDREEEWKADEMRRVERIKTDYAESLLMIQTRLDAVEKAEQDCQNQQAEIRAELTKAIKKLTVQAVNAVDMQAKIKELGREIEQLSKLIPIKSDK